MRYNKSETRIINNAIKMADEVKKYHERTQSWDIPEPVSYTHLRAHET